MHPAVPTLSEFVAGFLHQDWPDDFATVDDVAREYLALEPHKASTLARDVRTLLDGDHSEDDLRRILEGLGSQYWPPGDGITHREYLQGLLGIAETGGPPSRE